MACGATPCSCGCCAGVEFSTPRDVANPPGQPVLRRRAGDWAAFRESLFASLASADESRRLRTRAPEDPAVALCDAEAVMLDVLAFYSERIAQEGYLGTATERASLAELARGIGYAPAPGVAAACDLRFFLDETPGSPETADIPPGTKVQSLPGPGESPQTFETVEAVTAKARWNAMRPQAAVRRDPRFGDTEAAFLGAGLNLQVGDLLLFVGGENRRDIAAERWDVRKITGVTIDAKAGTTRATWAKGLGYLKGGRRIDPAASDPEVFVFRQKANVFGFNAQPFATVPDATKRDAYGLGDTESVSAKTEWPGFDIFPGSGRSLDLDQAYPKILQDSFLVLSAPAEGAAEGYRELFRVTAASESAQAAFGISAKTTRLVLAGENFGIFRKRRRETTVYAVPESLALAPAPWAQGEDGNPGSAPWRLDKGMPCPAAGVDVRLRDPAPVLEPGRKLLLTGKPVRLRIDAPGLFLEPGGGLPPRALDPGEMLITESRPAGQGNGLWRWQARALDGMSGALALRADQATLCPADERDAEAAEALFLAGPVPDGVETVLDLHFATAALRFYDRLTVSLSANVAAATHGETVKEVLEGGDASAAFQRMRLKQGPVTYVPVPSGAGAAGTLQIRVGGVLWRSVPSLFAQAGDAEVYAARHDDPADPGKVSVTFGDGATGARLPTGAANVEATYRKGIGLAGEVGANRLTQLLTRPLGVKSVTNPVAALGAADAEDAASLRANAPMSVRTLGRVVSLGDYQDFAAAFAGIGKARADWLWDGERRIVHLTLATASGRSPAADADLIANLASAMDGARDMRQIVRIAGFAPLEFKVAARLLIDARYLPADVFAAAEAALAARFAFPSRSLGQSLRSSEVIAALQGVAGVIAVDLDALHLAGTPPALEDGIVAHAARWNPGPDGGSVSPAELLTLAPRGADLQEMAP